MGEDKFCIEKIVETAKEFIEENPDKRTASFSLTKEEYVEFKKMNLPEGYKTISEHLDLDKNNYKIFLAKGDFNWLTGGYH